MCLSVEDLLPVSDGGLVVTSEQGYTMSCLTSAQKGEKVATVQVNNQSTLFNVVASFGGVKLIVAPGATMTWTAPVGTYLITDFRFDFETIAGAAAHRARMVIITQKYVKQ